MHEVNRGHLVANHSTTLLAKSCEADVAYSTASAARIVLILIRYACASRVESCPISKDVGTRGCRRDFVV